MILRINYANHSRSLCIATDMISKIQMMFQPKKKRRIANPYCSRWIHVIIPQIHPMMGKIAMINDKKCESPKYALCAIYKTPYN